MSGDGLSALEEELGRFKDPALFALIEKFVLEAGFRGQIDIDIFEVDGVYYMVNSSFIYFRNKNGSHSFRKFSKTQLSCKTALTLSF